MTDATRELRGTFTHVTGREPDGVWSAPGRVNLIGKHTGGGRRSGGRPAITVQSAPTQRLVPSRLHRNSISGDGPDRERRGYPRDDILRGHRPR